MRSILLIISMILMLVASMITLSGCGTSGTKYCKVSGCPSESAIDAKYCYEHKCVNYSCKNRAIGSYSYCKKCIERAR